MKRMISGVLIGMALLTTASIALAGSDQRIWATIRLSQASYDSKSRTWKTSPLPWGADGYQILAGSYVKASVNIYGDGDAPADVIASTYAESTGKAVVSTTGPNLWRVLGNGRVYFHCTIRSASVNFYLMDAVGGVVSTKKFPVVTMKLLTERVTSNQENVEVRLYTSQQIAGHLRVYQFNGNLIAEYATPVGTFTQSIPETNGLIYFSGSTAAIWSLNGYSAGIILPDGIMSGGVDIPTIQVSSPDNWYHVEFETRIYKPT